MEEIFEDFEAYIRNSAIGYSSNDIYYYAGNDFDFFSEYRFLSLDALINFYQDRPCKGIDIEYSGPLKYFLSLIEKRKKNTK